MKKFPKFRAVRALLATAVLSVVAAGVWVTHGAAVTWSLLVVALGLLLLGHAPTRRPEPVVRGCILG